MLYERDDYGTYSTLTYLHIVPDAIMLQLALLLMIINFTITALYISSPVMPCRSFGPMSVTHLGSDHEIP